VNLFRASFTFPTLAGVVPGIPSPPARALGHRKIGIAHASIRHYDWANLTESATACSFALSNYGIAVEIDLPGSAWKLKAVAPTSGGISKLRCSRGALVDRSPECQRGEVRQNNHGRAEAVVIDRMTVSGRGCGGCHREARTV